MPSNPPKYLESAVGLLIPPACREEVLGDLCETYTGPAQYIFLALRVVPFVILSRILRTTDTYILLTEALLIYGSYLAAAWYTDRTILINQWGLVRLLIPTVLQLAVPILDRAWNPGKWPLRLIQGGLIGISAYFNLPGSFASLLLITLVEFLFRRKEHRPQATTGPALWVESPVTSRIAMIALAAAAIALVAILFSSRRPGMAEILVVVILVVLLPRFGKE